MQQNPKVQIYKGMIQYLLESTNYKLQTIADFSDTSFEYIRSIYLDEFIPSGFTSESQLIKLFHIVVSLNIKSPQQTKFVVEINKIFGN